ncbi:MULTISPECIES: cell envelope integrity protein TolA [Enterobacter cloacae complex]|jgi:TolA protein|uniref:cell envelope integrity protein TolA n=1 Tax=Enterobacter cloacae complex TaxID=354276 RepID=UPI000D6F55A2|nr:MULTISPECIES: cell envelope integrity protein TolA [Enterobacter cloacae complex]EKV3692684.1 cell envelope integrity protein TolA [Enterobacter hormaechei]EKV4586511.1 cell envelope integrity protein TolA [Enterobacter hormaechei]MBF1938058.1 cell envelope integrity protein TolA [Enterobacter hormaechei]MBF9209952.1 cell envelope integrity protein TolA [Enterobacter hormaechei]MBY7162011.1 cell envelope integrity protein TolA [Enterobacter hormaechei]
MQPKSVLPLVLFIPLFLAACTAAPQTRSGKPGKSETTQVVNDVPGDLKAGPNENIASYATKIKRSIEEKIYRPESYKGQECTLRILLARDGLVMSATAENGNQELCNAALIAVKQANIPPAPDEKTWQSFRNASLDFSY